MLGINVLVSAFTKILEIQIQSTIHTLEVLNLNVQIDHMEKRDLSSVIYYTFACAMSYRPHFHQHRRCDLGSAGSSLRN